MKTLYSLCQTKVKVWKELPEGSHNDTVAEPNYFNYIDEFILRQVKPRSRKALEK
jgi:hypothetical protein